MSTAAIIAGTAGIGAIGYTLFDRYRTQTWWWEKPPFVPANGMQGLHARSTSTRLTKEQWQAQQWQQKNIRDQQIFAAEERRAHALAKANCKYTITP